MVWVEPDLVWCPVGLDVLLQVPLLSLEPKPLGIDCVCVSDSSRPWFPLQFVQLETSIIGLAGIGGSLVSHWTECPTTSPPPVPVGQDLWGLTVSVSEAFTRVHLGFPTQCVPMEPLISGLAGIGSSLASDMTVSTVIAAQDTTLCSSVPNLPPVSPLSVTGATL